MRLHNIIDQTQPQPRTLTGWLGGEEWLKNFVPDVVRDARAIINHPDLNPIFKSLG